LEWFETQVQADVRRILWNAEVFLNPSKTSKTALPLRGRSINIRQC
jgi:hypothetical protein